MAERRRRKASPRARVLALLCNIVGTLLLVGVIALLIPLTVPRLRGEEVYKVLSGSMEPALPQGSLVIVTPTEPSLVEPDTVVAYSSGGSVVTHRVVSNDVVAGTLVTKGDANEDEDPEPVPYARFLGVVRRHFPYLGTFMAALTTMVGKLYLFCLIACGVMFNLLAGYLRD